MSKAKLFEVIKVTATEEGDGFITKFQWKDEVTVAVGKDGAFGSKTSKLQETYYAKLESELTVGEKGELNLDSFDVVAKPFIADDGTEIVCKWLFPKKPE